MKKKLGWGITAGVIVIAAAAVFSTQAGGPVVEAAEVSRGEIRQYLEDTAHVILKEKQTVFIEGTGRIIDINADVGDAVGEGDMLLTLDKTDLELQLKDAEAKIEAAKAQLKGTELINYANRIELARAAADQARISHDLAQRDFDKAKKLHESGAISEDEFDKAQDAYKAAVVALDAANLQLADVKQGAPEHVKNSYKAQLEQAVVYRETILRNLQKQEVRAAMDGVVIERLIEEGSLVVPSTVAFIIGDVNNLELEADILTDDIGKVKAGNEVEISGKAIRDAVLKGRVVKIAPAARTVASSLGISQRRVPVTIELTGSSDLLKPGFDLDIKIITQEKKDVLIIPDSAVFDYMGESCVFAAEDGKAVLKKVEKGIESGDLVEITSGLAEGEKVVLNPDNSLKDGMRIRMKLEEE
jgi:HlyD family secretion protein